MMTTVSVVSMSEIVKGAWLASAVAAA